MCVCLCAGVSVFVVVCEEALDLSDGPSDTSAGCSQVCVCVCVGVFVVCVRRRWICRLGPVVVTRRML